MTPHKLVKFNELLKDNDLAFNCLQVALDHLKEHLQYLQDDPDCKERLLATESLIKILK